MAVYTEVQPEALAHFLDSYGLGELVSVKGIAEGVENSNYLVQTARGSYILTLYEKRVRRDDLPFFLGLMEHLAGRGITCPTPLRDLEGRMLRELAGRPAAIVSFLEGISVKRPSVAHCAGLGEALAGLHQAGEGFKLTRENALSLAGWREIATRLGEDADKVSAGLGALIETELDELERRWPAGLPVGVIHADLFPNNVFFRGDRLSGLIDFYFACNDMFAYDIAVCLNAWCFEADHAFNVTKARAMLEAYRRGRGLSPEEIAALPILARGAALRFLLTRAHDWLHTAPTALVNRLDPQEYVRKLRFHREVRSAGEYGIDGAI
ncbi:MAG: homoserine kinase [Hyphomicrobiaceae bacterium]